MAGMNLHEQMHSVKRKKQMQETGIGTKSQQALKLQQEQNRQERKMRSREKSVKVEIR